MAARLEAQQQQENYNYPNYAQPQQQEEEEEVEYVPAPAPRAGGGKLRGAQAQAQRSEEREEREEREEYNENGDGNGENENTYGQEEEESVGKTNNNFLSRLVSPQLPPPHSSSDPSTHTSTAPSVSAEKPKPRNPFAVVSTGQTPLKRKSVFDGIQDLKASPSPKKPALSRQSTFSQVARQQRLSDKRIL
jgi:hypothetical protein